MKSCEMRPTVDRPYPRRIESDYKGNTPSYFETPSVGLARVSNPQPPARWSDTQLTEPTGQRFYYLDILIS